MTQTNQYIIFTLAEEYYAIKIDSIENIEKIMDITRVPKTPDYVKGVINMRGEIAPIVDLRLRLGLPAKEHDDNTRIILNKINDNMIGYIVDSTYEVTELNISSIEGNLNENKNQDTYIEAIAKDNGRMIILLDMEKIMKI